MSENIVSGCLKQRRIIITTISEPLVTPTYYIKMPHFNLPVPSAGFQALILCGPGVSLNTFTSNPEEYPKALVPIANRPMVWYPLDWCYRLGITSKYI
jgi:hypothetical protein